jgi:hypothetical protein
VYRPLRDGTVGVIEGDYQYVHHLNKNKFELRPLNAAQNWNLDRSAEYPQKAEALRQRIRDRFPGMIA